MLGHFPLLPPRRRQNFQDCSGDELTCRIGALSIQNDDPLSRAFFARDKILRHRDADRQGALEVRRHRADSASWPWQRRTDQGRQDRCDDARRPRSRASSARGSEVIFSGGGGAEFSPATHMSIGGAALKRLVVVLRLLAVFLKLQHGFLQG